MAEYGPMSMIISAWVKKVFQRALCVNAGRKAFLWFEQVATMRDVLSSMPLLDDVLTDKSIARTMIESVREIDDEDLTPMAAVAGSLADATSDFIFSHGATKVVVNNGGDIAVRILGDNQVRVGIGYARPECPIPKIIMLDSSCSSWGIATSGLGGRSFTMGVASAVTIIARTAALADAAATSVANATFVEDDNVVQRKAGDIDPGTDIPNLRVTTKVGPLSYEKRTLALQRGIKKANRIIEKGNIYGARVTVDGETDTTSFFQNHLENTK